MRMRKGKWMWLWAGLLSSIWVASGAGTLKAEVHRLTLRQAIEAALKQNPEIALARLDEAFAAQQVRITRDPFSPRVTVGSGLAYSSGFPLSIEGSAPAAFQAQASAALFNRPLTYRVAQARENARGAQFDTAGRRDDVMYRVAALCFDLQRLSALANVTRQQVEALRKVEQVTGQRVSEGRALPLETRRALFNTAQARHELQVAETQLQQGETALASVLGFNPGDRVEITDDRLDLNDEVPESRETAVQIALRSNPEIRRLESAIVATGFEIKSYRASRLPTVDLVAQYAVLTRFNNYADFFNRFERHNWQIGGSFRLPIVPGLGAAAGEARAQIEQNRLRNRLAARRSQIWVDVGQSYSELDQARSARELAGEGLTLAREELTVVLAQWEEGRATMGEVEQARFLEQERWKALYEAEFVLERARLGILRQTGTLASILQ